MISIYPYKIASQSAQELRKGLSQALGYRVKLVRPDGRFKPRRGDVVINWGNTTNPSWEWCSNPDLNPPAQVQAACNKLSAFWAFKNKQVPTPDWTINQNEAQTWLDNGDTIVVRHSLTGHSGQGIEVVSEGQLPDAPLYTKYKKKRAEYRVHVLKGQVIDTTQKRKLTSDNRPPTFNTRIRNHTNGWVFCHDNVEPNPFRDTVAILAVKALSLDFGAVDIIYNESENQHYALEVNTAPGLEGTSLQKYVEALTQ